MIPPASFTQHAFERMRARLSLTAAEVAKLLDSDRVVLIGKETDSSTIHRLFYSAPDNYCFVAIQDEITGEVVTVVPVDYRKAFRVSEEAAEMAKRIVVGLPARSEPIKEEPKGAIKQVHLHFKCIFSYDGIRKEVKLGVCAIRAEIWVVESDLFRLTQKSEVLNWLSEKLDLRVPAEANEKQLYIKWSAYGERKTQWMYIKGFFEEEFL
ncbi:MAG: hypothetical protein HYT22_00865 [Candidatus Niyogibacteria bacterium]|nr:hypothetical protein [Candidatus Niyogibacteria bacterium]